MLRVLCTALNAEEGPHFNILKQAGFACDVVDRSLNLWDARTLAGAIEGYHGLIAGSEPYPADVILGSAELRVFARAGVGFDAINLPACDQRGVVVSTTPGVNHHAVAEHSIALLMAIARGFPSGDQEVRRTVWNRVSRPRVMGSTIGIVGLGRIGQAVATRAIGLGMKVVAYDPYPPAEFVTQHSISMATLGELLAASDYVSLHLPMSPETFHLINAQSIEQMKPGAVLINTARGLLVDEPALIAALKSGRLRGAGLDVFEVEPLPADSPLLTMDNVLLSGHVAGLDNESHEGTYEMAADTIIQLRDGSWPAERIQNLKGITGWTWESPKGIA